VLSGRILRGGAERIDAVIWFSDLRGFTRITDSAPEQVIPLLNDYADVIVSAIHGGDVLKLIATASSPSSPPPIVRTPMQPRLPPRQLPGAKWRHSTCGARRHSTARSLRLGLATAISPAATRRQRTA
jgi:hypothetical protein